jgi:hypothetical protein
MMRNDTYNTARNPDSCSRKEGQISTHQEAYDALYLIPILRREILSRV